MLSAGKRGTAEWDDQLTSILCLRIWQTQGYPESPGLCCTPLPLLSVPAIELPHLFGNTPWETEAWTLCTSDYFCLPTCLPAPVRSTSFWYWDLIRGSKWKTGSLSLFPDRSSAKLLHQILCLHLSLYLVTWMQEGSEKHNHSILIFQRNLQSKTVDAHRLRFSYPYLQSLFLFPELCVAFWNLDKLSFFCKK